MAGSSFSVPTGQYTLQVSVTGGCSFQNFTYPGGSNASNPMAFTVAGDMTVTAYYTAPCYWLTVYAYCYYQYEGPIPTSVSIDSGQWTGTADDSFHVPAGNRMVEVEETVYGEWGQAWFYYFDGYELDLNPICVSVSSDTEVTAIYWSWYRYKLRFKLFLFPFCCGVCFFLRFRR